ncbi:MAG: glycosyltransferase family 2 protein [Oscillospiraceae bacterium]|nr:glycosyltransferase family 2 protein [Oscillospiraceae bacterium]
MSEEKKAKISIIVPCFNEQEVLPLFLEKVTEVMKSMGHPYELLFIDDGSKDRTLGLLQEWAEQDEQVKYLTFSRNFGKEAAMYAGLCNASGDYVAVMDADLQDPPELLPQMVRILEEEDYDCVATCRETRKGEPPVRSWFAKKFYQIMNRISDADIRDGARDYRLMKRKMVDAIVRMTEYNRFSKGIFGWVGFRTYWLPYGNVERAAGQSKWSFWKLFRYALEGFINFSHVPLSIASWFGFFMTGLAFVMLVFIVVRKLLFGDPVAGWASTICVIIFIGGIQLFCTGVMGQYIAKIYSETKNRPHYIVADSNLDDVKQG